MIYVITRNTNERRKRKGENATLVGQVERSETQSKLAGADVRQHIYKVQINE